MLIERCTRDINVGEVRDRTLQGGAAGGYLPTFGIMGAVLGLIHTMSMLNEPAKLGDGIATAFVATLYGVGAANLLAYPISKKIRARANAEKELDKIVIMAIKGIPGGSARNDTAPGADRRLHVLPEFCGPDRPQRCGLKMTASGHQRVR